MCPHCVLVVLATIVGAIPGLRWLFRKIRARSRTIMVHCDDHEGCKT
jgi:hypothetical protein